MTEQQRFIQTVENSKTKVEVIRSMGWTGWNSAKYRKFDKFVKETGVDISHFAKNGKWQEKHNKIIKTCPVCGDKFETRTNSREKTTCGFACSNTYFRSGENHGNWNEDSNDVRKYRKKCFDYYGESCLLCGWIPCVEVHHLDKNRDNNEIENLIPLCPNHHKMVHHPDHQDETLKEIKGRLTG